MCRSVCATGTSGYTLRTAGCIYANSNIVSAGEIAATGTICSTSLVKTPIVCGTTCVVSNRFKAVTGVNGGLLAGTDSVTQTFLNGSSHYRPFLKVEGTYPHIDIIANTSNANHGGTLRFATTIDAKQWVIGTSACDLRWMDIGWACANAHNPHYGIAGLPDQAGGTMMRFTCQGVLINSNNCLVYPNMPVAGSYGLDVRGTARVTGTLTGDGIICAATCVQSPIVCATNVCASGTVCGNVVCAGGTLCSGVYICGLFTCSVILVKSDVICATGCVRTANIDAIGNINVSSSGNICVSSGGLIESPIVCATSCIMLGQCQRIRSKSERKQIFCQFACVWIVI